MKKETFFCDICGNETPKITYRLVMQTNTWGQWTSDFELECCEDCKKKLYEQFEQRESKLDFYGNFFKAMISIFKNIPRNF